MAVSVSERGHIVWGTCKGRLGKPGKKGTRGTRGATPWALYINNNSKNPYEQSSVREEFPRGAEGPGP